MTDRMLHTLVVAHLLPIAEPERNRICSAYCGGCVLVHRVVSLRVPQSMCVMLCMHICMQWLLNYVVRCFGVHFGGVCSCVCASCIYVYEIKLLSDTCSCQGYACICFAIKFFHEILAAAESYEIPSSVLTHTRTKFGYKKQIEQNTWRHIKVEISAMQIHTLGT